MDLQLQRLQQPLGLQQYQQRYQELLQTIETLQVTIQTWECPSWAWSVESITDQECINASDWLLNGIDPWSKLEDDLHRLQQGLEQRHQQEVQQSQTDERRWKLLLLLLAVAGAVVAVFMAVQSARPGPMSPVAPAEDEERAPDSSLDVGSVQGPVHTVDSVESAETVKAVTRPADLPCAAPPVAPAAVTTGGSNAADDAGRDMPSGVPDLLSTRPPFHRQQWRGQQQEVGPLGTGGRPPPAAGRVERPPALPPEE